MAAPAPTDLAAAGEFLPALLDLLPTGVIGYSPLQGEDGQVVDFTFAYLNPAAQRLLGLPAQPAATYTQQFPASRTNGGLSFLLAAYQSDETGRFEGSYPAADRHKYFRVAARRLGNKLLVTLAPAADQPRPPAQGDPRPTPDPAEQEQAARQQAAQEQAEHERIKHEQDRREQDQREQVAIVQAAHEHAERERTERERTASAQAERERNQWPALVNQAPVAIGLFEGPELRIAVANQLLCATWGRTQAEVLHRPLLEAVPALQSQEFGEIMRQVRETRAPFVGTEVPTQLPHDGELVTSYHDFVYQPFYDVRGQVTGVLTVAVDVTEQVLARQQLQQLNDELEHRVAERTAETQAALHQAQAQGEQLQVQQGLLSQILGQVPAIIATVSGPAHQFSFLNAQFQHVVAGRAQLGQPLLEALPELVGQGYGNLLGQVYRTGQPHVGQEMALVLEPANGPASSRYVDCTFQPLLDGQGQVQGVLLFAVDVTERVRSRGQAETMQAALLAAAQRQARQRQELFQVFEQTPVAIVLLRESDHRIDYFNPAFEELFPPDEWRGGPLQGHTIGQVYPRISEAGLVALLDGVFLSGESQSVLDMPLAELQPGSPRYVTFAYQAYREQGQIVGVAAFVYDTTEQVLARQRAEAIQRRLQLTTDALPVLIGYLDQQQRFQFANRTYEIWFNQKPRDLLGRTLREIATEARYESVRPYLERALAGEWVEFDSHMAFDHDVARHIHTLYIPDLKHGQVVGCFTLVTDITDQVLARQHELTLNKELATANEALQASNNRLMHTNIDLDTFVYSASHDLKAPIANIEGLLLALREQLPPATQQAELVQRMFGMMDGAVQRFQQTLGHLTNVSRLQQSLAEQTPVLIDLPALVESVRLDMLPELTAAGATLTVDVAQCPAICFSVKNLRSVLYNLLSNAVKYHAPNQPPVVQLRCRCATGGGAVLEVQDNGLGLSEAQQTGLFQLFRRLHSHVSGSGVGLYMVKKMVDNAGGSVTVQSEPGAGSTFTVTLPKPNCP